MESIQKLQMRGVTRRFGAATALDHFDLEIKGGSFVSLLGPSGCGKTTALNCLAGLLDLSEGEIILNGRAIQDVPAEKRGFGMVFQNYALFPHLTAFRNVAYGLELRRVKKEERQQRVRRALEIVHLEAFEKRYPGQLSGGQQQRLALARTIVLEPSLLLLDEPLSNLDANLRNEMRVEIKRIHDELGLTTLYVTHDQSEAMSLSDLVVVMRLGRIEQLGTPQEIYTRPRSLYVANFMGYANHMPVTVVQRNADGFLVRATTGAELLATSNVAESQDWQPGQEVLAAFRPDETRSDLAETRNQLRGKVQLVEYLGKAFEALVHLENGGQQLLVHSPVPLASGAEIEFRIAPERLLLFPTENPGLSGATPVPQPQPAPVEGRR